MTSAFDLTVPRASCNSRFLLLNDHVAYEGTRRLIDELLTAFCDKDGEFVKRLQTTEFEARLWELYLHACLREAGIATDSTYNRPDFAGKKDDDAFFIEAVTTNPPPGEDGPSPDADMPDDVRGGGDINMLRLMRAVRKKIAKKYQELPWVTGKPVGIALAPFHGPTALHYSDSALQQYVWGFEPVETRDELTGEPIRRLERVTQREIDGEVVGYGWFGSQESSHVSAVIYSATATIAKFHRMAMQLGYCDQNTVSLVHVGSAYDPDPSAFEPRYFGYVVRPTTDGELWADGLSIIHNPHAIVPFPECVFRSGMETRLRDGRLVNSIPPFHPYSSTTYCVIGDGAPGKGHELAALMQNTVRSEEFRQRLLESVALMH